LSERVTYVSIGASPEFDREFEGALAAARAELPVDVVASIGGGRPSGGARVDLVAPADRRLVVARVERSSAGDVATAVETAARAFDGWRRRPWTERLALARAAADRIAAERFRLAALVALEVGKTRLEAMAEVEEAADLLRYYAERYEAAGGYRRPMARALADEATESVLLPYGAWAVVSPFNFPMALAAGMIGAALLTGNTVVFKPSEEAALSGALLARALWSAGIPREVVQLVHGGGETGAALAGDPRIAGVAFTGSYEVGMAIARALPRQWPRPAVIEMGGKNPAIVTATADVDAAALAVARSAFGYGGQKCSACSRAYVERPVYERFVAALLAAATAMKVGDPTAKGVAFGPLIDERAAARFAAAIEAIRAAGGVVLTGGHRLTDGELAHGVYVEPTVATLPDAGHELWDRELFLPLVLLRSVDGLDEALALANRSRFGLTAGLFAGDRGEIERFLDGIEAGVVYVNRRAGATTGAWPGINPFGGWKGSGGTGVAALGPDYLAKFVREQSRAVTAPW
jgi:1-pyrroline-5-carboxylate dehydrogenase